MLIFQQGLRNYWPYVYPTTDMWEGEIYYSTAVLSSKAKDIAVDPVLRAKLYCYLIVYPHWGEYSVQCRPGNSTKYLDMWKQSPLGMLRDNISLSVFNAIFAFPSLILGIFGK